MGFYFQLIHMQLNVILEDLVEFQVQYICLSDQVYAIE